MNQKNKIGIKLFDGTFVPVLNVNEPKSKRLVLTTVQDNQKKAIIELYEGSNNNCMYNEFLGKLIINIDRETEKGQPGIEVNLRLDENGILHAKAWDAESNEQSTMMIEHSSGKKIRHETEKIDNFTKVAEKKQITDYQETEKKSRIIPIILITLAILIFLALLSLGIYFFAKNIYPKISSYFTNKDKIEKKVEEPKKEEPKIEEKKIIEEKKEVIGKKKLEGKIHYIRWGDNLWNICIKYYGDPWYYPSLAEVNEIKKPRLIYAGTTIIIPQKSDLKRWSFLE